MAFSFWLVPNLIFTCTAKLPIRITLTYITAELVISLVSQNDILEWTAFAELKF